MDKEKLQIINDNVKLLLEKYPKLRNPFLRKQAHWRYWKDFGNLGYVMTEEMYVKSISAETISRAIRAIQEKYPNLRPTRDLEHKQLEMMNEHKNYYSKNK